MSLPEPESTFGKIHHEQRVGVASVKGSKTTVRAWPLQKPAAQRLKALWAEDGVELVIFPYTEAFAQAEADEIAGANPTLEEVLKEADGEADPGAVT